jgi:hypothetical protein
MGSASKKQNLPLVKGNFSNFVRYFHSKQWINQLKINLLGSTPRNLFGLLP